MPARLKINCAPYYHAFVVRQYQRTSFPAIPATPFQGWYIPLCTSTIIHVHIGCHAPYIVSKNQGFHSTAFATDKLIYEAHQYLDGKGGTTTPCNTNGVNDTLVPMTAFLRSAGRKAMLTETGGGNTASCVTDVCEELSYLNSNSDVWLGWAGWAAGMRGPPLLFLDPHF